jgi:hypothetical protein
MRMLFPTENRAARVVLVSLGILMIPLVAMQFTEEVTWTASDFIFAGILLIGTGLAYVGVTAVRKDPVYRSAVAAAIGTTFLLIWVNVAVGVIGSEDNPANAMYLGVLAVAGVGSVFARFRARAMAAVMVAAVIAHVVITAVAIHGDMGAPESGPLHVAAVNGFFASLWLIAAALFAWAAENRRSSDA